jgi:pterin-4a-carbinolamine dehydratase
MFLKRKKYFCELFGNFISRKSGQKCCVYGQNGKPLSKETVIKFLNTLKNSDLDYINNEMISDRNLVNWSANEDFTRLSRLFYFKNVFSLTDFIKEIYNLDYTSNLQQIPNISVSNKEILKIELYTPALKGLAIKDLQLATAINSLNFKNFQLVPIKDEKDYRKEIRSINIEENKSKIDYIEKSKLKNKYDSISYEKSAFEENNSGCSNPGGCACSQAKEQNKYTF